MIRNIGSTESAGGATLGRGAISAAPAERRKATPSGELFFGAFIAAALFWGWINRGSHLSAESGIGYYAGIIGALLMLALLAYPLRKHAPFMRKAGPVAWWFRTHMALGLIGPTLILYHANFSLGSINSNVALYSMLTVAASGLVGRYIYSKIHKGLYGARAEMRSLAGETADLRRLIGDEIDAGLADRLESLENAAFKGTTSIGAAMCKAFVQTASARRLHGAYRRRLRKALHGLPRNSDRRRTLLEHRALAGRYFQSIEQAAELGFYDRLFAAWHVLHLPLFILLILTAIVHVVAVHLY